MSDNRIINTRNRVLMVVIASLIIFAIAGIVNTYAVTMPTASGQVKADGGAYLRKKASTSSSKVKLLKNKTKITIEKEIFISKTSTKAKKKWYYVSASGENGYIRSDLVDNIKYNAISGKTTDSLNYRIGASEKMKKKGTFKKGASLTIVQKANLKGNSDVWYKVKNGANYYYVNSKYVNLNNSVNTKKPTTIANAVPTFQTSNLTRPGTLSSGTSFSLQGTISCSGTIQKVKIGFTDSSGKWVKVVTKDVNSGTFDISTVDGSLKFGELPVGDYKYCCRVYVGGKEYVEIDSAFKIAKLKGPALLAKTAIDLCWPAETSSSKYAYTGGFSTASYKTALDAAFGSRSSWGKYTKVGASCDVFISTVCRFSGYDTNMERSLEKQWESFRDTTKWSEVPYTGRESELQNGDILIYKKENGQHVTMYVKINGKGYLAEAAYYPDNPTKSKYPFINSSISKIFKSYTKIKVYRAAK